MYVNNYERCEIRNWHCDKVRFVSDFKHANNKCRRKVYRVSAEKTIVNGRDETPIIQRLKGLIFHYEYN